MKIVSSAIAHKSDIGGVAVGVAPEQVSATFERLKHNALLVVNESQLDGVSVQEMAPQGIEFIVGGVVDPGFGPMLVVGVGGTLAELLDDAAVLPAPCSREQVAEALGGLRAASILKGLRGQPARDTDTLIDVAVRVSCFLAVHADVLVAVDLNPVIVHEQGQGATVVDALVITHED
jgi:hypothetical protein